MKLVKTALILTLWNLLFIHANGPVKLWQTVELEFTSEQDYTNPYTEVEVWIQLTGPNFNKKIWGITPD